MTDQRKITDAKAGDKGNITHVKLDGNSNYTSVEKAIEMAEQERIENAHAVHKQDGSKYLRTNPDNRKGNNLDEMAGD